MLRSTTLIAALMTATVLHAEPPRVVTDIAPVHGLVAMVMDGVGQPQLLLDQGASAHDFALRPSQAKMLSNADLVVWIGPDLNPQLGDALDDLLTGQRLTLEDAAGTQHLPVRANAVFDGHDHDDADDEHQDDHEEDLDEAHGEHAEGQDPHLWLSPANATTWLTGIAEALAKADPEQAETYRANAAEAAAAIDDATAQAATILDSIGDRPLAVYHDAFQYYEVAFALNAIGAVSASDAASPGPARLAELRDHLAENRPVCVLREPGGATQLLEAVGGADLPTAELDPLGSALPLGTGFYPMLLTDLAQRIADCANSTQSD